MKEEIYQMITIAHDAQITVVTDIDIIFIVIIIIMYIFLFEFLNKIKRDLRYCFESKYQAIIEMFDANVMWVYMPSLFIN